MPASAGAGANASLAPLSSVSCTGPVAHARPRAIRRHGANGFGLLESYAPPEGYWSVASDGGIFNYGRPRPSTARPAACRLNAPMVGMAATPGGGGYWEVASDGGIFSYGNAPFHGSTGEPPPQQPVVGMAATPDGGGYWLVASDGGIFNYGDAGFYGSAGVDPPQQAHRGHGGHARRARLLAGGLRRRHLQLRRRRLLRLPRRPAPEQADRRHGGRAPRGLGYWLVASDGGIFSYGDAGFLRLVGLTSPSTSRSSA